MSEVGDLANDLGIAWATAWAFQFLVIVMPAERERTQFDALIAPRVDRLIGLGMEMVTMVDSQCGRPLRAEFAVDLADVKAVCDTVSLNDEAPGWNGSWGIVLQHLGSRAESVRATLRPFYGRLTPELLEALEQEDLAMDEILRMERFGRAFDAPNMARLEGGLSRWLTSIHMLVTLRSSSLAPELPVPEQSAVNTDVVKVPMDSFIRQHEEFKKSLEPNQ